MTFYICTFCNVFVYDSNIGDKLSGIKPGMKPKDLSIGWKCPVCGKPASYLAEIDEEKFKQKKVVYDRDYPYKEPEKEAAEVKEEPSKVIGEKAGETITSENLKKPGGKERAEKAVEAGQPPVEKKEILKDVEGKQEEVPKGTEEKELKDLVYYRSIARQKLAGTCAVNKVCDGDPERLCMGMKYGRPIGFGGAGQGRTWGANFKALANYRLLMRVIKKHKEPDIETEFLGNKINMPVMVSSMSGVKISMNDIKPEAEFQRGMLEGAKLFGTIGFSGNTVDFPDHPGIEEIEKLGGWGVPVFKPQSQERLLQLFARAEKVNVLAIAVDLDGYGSTNWALRGKPVYRKSAEEIRELIDSTDKPVILKGIMNLEDAKIAYKAGAAAIDVSNHGGRVMDYGLGVADVLPEISRKFKGKITILADGAVRTGYDVLKLLALGADIALIGRPLGRMSLAGGPEAVKMYLEYVRSDLRLAMLMTGCDSLEDVSKKIIVEHNYG